MVGQRTDSPAKVPFCDDVAPLIRSRISAKSEYLARIAAKLEARICTMTASGMRCAIRPGIATLQNVCGVPVHRWSKPSCQSH